MGWRIGPSPAMVEPCQCVYSSSSRLRRAPFLPKQDTPNTDDPYAYETEQKRERVG